MHAFRVVSLCVMYVLCRHVAGHVTPPPSGASVFVNQTPANAKIVNAVGRNGSPAPQVGGTSREGSTQPSAAGFTASTPGIGPQDARAEKPEVYYNKQNFDLGLTDFLDHYKFLHKYKGEEQGIFFKCKDPKKMNSQQS